MSSYDDYSRIHCKSILLSEAGVKFHLDTDDTKTITLKASPSASGNVDLQLPTSAGTLMRTADDLDSRNLAHGQNLVAVTPADGDGWLVFDTSDSDNPKRVTGTALKAYIDAGLPVGNTSANILVADGSGVFQSVALSGDATISNVGALTLANDSVGTAQIEASAVTASKVNITGASLLSGAVVAGDEVLLYDASTTSNVKVPMSGVATYVSANLTNNAVVTAKVADANITTAKLADDCVTSAKLAPAVALDTSVEAPIVYIGNNKWKMELSTNDLVFSYWNGSAWVVGQTISAP